jgi:hypothetical protein
MDAELAANPKFNQGDSADLIKKYGGATDQERRQKLMPFFLEHYCNQRNVVW